MWFGLAFVSAFLLGLYDISKKASLNGNAVIPVLFLNTLFCFAFFIPILVLSYCWPEVIQDTSFYLPHVDAHTHLYLFGKAAIVNASWICAYFAMKHLPITLASPIKASQPVLTLIGAMLIFGERLNGWQWAGIATALLSFFLLSRSGRKEGIHFSHNRWIWLIVAATILGGLSGLYDKFLLQRFDRIAVQVWYTFYQAVIMGAVFITCWYPQRKSSTPFQWRNSIFFISLFLILADFVYFYALSDPGAMVSIISMVRRSSAAISFIGGIALFHEKNIRNKAIDLVLMIIGMLFLYLGN